MASCITPTSLLNWVLAPDTRKGVCDDIFPKHVEEGPLSKPNSSELYRFHFLTIHTAMSGIHKLLCLRGEGGLIKEELDLLRGTWVALAISLEPIGEIIGIDGLTEAFVTDVKKVPSPEPKPGNKENQVRNRRSKTTAAPKSKQGQTAMGQTAALESERYVPVAVPAAAPNIKQNRITRSQTAIKSKSNLKQPVPEPTANTRDNKRKRETKELGPSKRYANDVDGEPMPAPARQLTPPSVALLSLAEWEKDAKAAIEANDREHVKVLITQLKTGAFNVEGCTRLPLLQHVALLSKIMSNELALQVKWRRFLQKMVLSLVAA